VQWHKQLDRALSFFYEQTMFVVFDFIGEVTAKGMQDILLFPIALIEEESPISKKQFPFMRNL